MKRPLQPTFTMWGFLSETGYWRKIHMYNLIYISICKYMFSHFCRSNIHVLNLISSTLQSNTCQDPVAEKTESISFLTRWYMKTRHCKRQGERCLIPPLRASADHWQDSARCRQHFPFKKLQRWSYLIGFKCRIDARLLSVCDTHRVMTEICCWWILMNSIML